MELGGEVMARMGELSKCSEDSGATHPAIPDHGASRRHCDGLHVDGVCRDDGALRCRRKSGWPLSGNR